MAIAHKISGLNRTNWSNKTDKQKVKILQKHYNSLGYKTPNYLNNNTISENNFNRALDRITKGYSKLQSKEQVKRVKQKELKKKIIKQGLTLDEQLHKAMEKYNTRIGKLIDMTKDFNLTENQYDYLLGEPVKLSIRNKVYFKDNNTLSEIDLTHAFFKGDKEKLNRLQEINKNYNKLSPSNFKKMLSDSSKSDQWFENFLDERFNFSLSDTDKKTLIHNFNRLSPLQKEIAIKTELGELRDKYKKMMEEGHSVDNVNIFNRINLTNIKILDEF